MITEIAHIQPTLLATLHNLRNFDRYAHTHTHTMEIEEVHVTLLVGIYYLEKGESRVVVMNISSRWTRSVE